MDLRVGERIDDTGFGNIKVIQKKDFGYGVDSILLAAFAMGETGAKAMHKPSRIADLGTGSGIVAFVLAHKLERAHQLRSAKDMNSELSILGYEVNHAAYDRALRAAELNYSEYSSSTKVSFICTDIQDIEGKHDYDAVVTNPPYFRRSNLAHDNSSQDRYMSRHETTATIADFGKISASMLRKGGSFYMVHRPDRLVDIMTSLRNVGLEPKEIQFILPEADRAPNIVLVHAIKGAGPELRILPSIAVHKADGSYTDDILRIYEV